MAVKAPAAKSTPVAGRRAPKKGEAPKAALVEKDITSTMSSFAEFIKRETGYEPDERSLQLGSTLRSDFQKSPENQQSIADRKAEIEQEKEAREVARQERAERKAEREEAKAAKAQEKADAPAKTAPVKKAATAKAPVKKAAPAKTAATPATKATPAKKATTRRRPAATDETDF